MARIVICRHGNTFDKGDTVTRVGARTDLPLSSSGQAQAKALREVFSPDASDYNFTKAYCSKLMRTRQTAEAILQAGHSAQSPETLEFLTEIDYGPDENMSEEAVITRIGAEAIEAWDQDARVPDGWQVDSKGLINNWRSFIQKHAESDEDILAVTSNGIARFVLQAIPPSEIAKDIKLKTGAFGILICQPEAISLQSWNQRA